MSVLIGVRLHYLKEGWIIDMFPLFGQPPVDGMDPVIAGARFFLIPPQSAYDEVDAESEL